MEGSLPHLLAAAMRHTGTHLTSTNYPANAKGDLPGAVGAGAHPGTPVTTRRHRSDSKQTPTLKPGTSTFSNHALRALTH
jgi:hypothetical protein